MMVYNSAGQLVDSSTLASNAARYVPGGTVDPSNAYAWLVTTPGLQGLLGQAEYARADNVFSLGTAAARTDELQRLRSLGQQQSTASGAAGLGTKTTGFVIPALAIGLGLLLSTRR